MKSRQPGSCQRLRFRWHPAVFDHDDAVPATEQSRNSACRDRCISAVDRCSGARYGARRCEGSRW